MGSIHHPTAAPSASPQIAIYLPRGNVLHDNPAADDASNIAILKSRLPCHVVSINYRWTEHPHQFPSPIHDVLAGFDWIVENLLPSRGRAITTRRERSAGNRIVVCGSLLGGQLATSLALTECRLGEVGRISAATVNNPVIDWTALEDLEEADSDKSSSQQQQGLSIKQALLQQRKILFQKKEHWFDTFASPALLFRSAGVEIPRDVSSLPFDDDEDEMSELARLDREEFFLQEQQQQALSSVSSSSGAFSPPPPPPPPPPSSPPIERLTKRKASRRFPSKALGLQIPTFRITTGETSPLADQAMELAHLIRQSRDRVGNRHADSQIPVQFVETPGTTGTWDCTNGGRASMLESADWLAHVLSI